MRGVKVKVATALLVVAGAFAASAVNCITDVMLIGETNKSAVTTLQNTYKEQGWKVINQDLNAGCGSSSDYIYLLYKVADSASASNGFITGFYIMTNTGSSRVPQTMEYKDRTYRLVPYDGGNHFKNLQGDLNSNAGGDAIHLYCTKSAFPDGRGVTSISFNGTQSGAVGAGGDSEGYDLNENAHGDYIYMHVSTDTGLFVVTDVDARQQWPRNGLVDITCKVSGIDGTNYGLEFAVEAVMSDSSVHSATNFWVVNDGRKPVIQGVCTNGEYRLLWDAGADLGTGEIHSNVVVRVAVVKGHAKVQLWEGGPYWAVTNIGAEKPEDYGYYFWWGDTVGYRREGEKWVATNGSSSKFVFDKDNTPTRYKDIDTLKSEGWITADDILAPEHDAAHVHWGGDWRMPTNEELDDIIDKCNWNETERNNVKGWTITGKDDYDSASLFLPCAGWGVWSSLGDTNVCYVWSSVPYSDNARAWVLSMEVHGTRLLDRYWGEPVRPLKKFTVATMGKNAGTSSPMVLDLTVVSFDEAAYSADEGGTLEVVVKGGNATMPSRVAVCLSYLTASAADLDLKNGAVDGVTPKGGLKFPLLLAWDAGDKAPKRISIPVKADKTVEGYESFVLQLAERVGMGPGKTVTAWATIADRNDKTLKPTVSPYKPKKGESVATNEVTVGVSPSDLGFAAGTGKYTAGTKLTMVAEARPGCAFVGWERNGKIESDKPKYQIVVLNDVAYTAKFAAVDYMSGLANPADSGKVTGNGFCPAGKKVTLKASASKGFAFVGWTTDAARSASAPYQDGDFVATTASLVIDRTAKPAKDSKTSTTISNLTESTTFYAVFTGDPLVSAIPVLVDGDVGLVSNEVGKVTGAGRYAPGKKVTLKATANKGFAFSGFFDAEGNLLDETRSASYSFEMGDEDVPLTARFVTVDADKDSIAANVDGWELEPWVSKTETHALTTNVWAGVYLEWPLAASALSQTTVKVSGLPAGLKFTAKDILKKGSKTEVDVPANTIYGVPTAASKTGKDGNPVPSTVKVTVTTAGKSSATYEIALTVDPLPAWVAGSFDGMVSDSSTGGSPVQEGDENAQAARSTIGTVSLTIAANGKISGKLLESGKTWTLSAASFERVEVLDSLEQLEPLGSLDESLVFRATVIGKAGNEVATNEVTVTAADGVGVVNARAARSTSGTDGSSVLYEWTAYQNLWKRADTKASQPVFKTNIDKMLGNGLKLTFKKDGVVSFSGKIGSASVSGSSQLVSDGETWKMTIYAPAKKGFAGYCATFAITLVDDQNVVTAIDIRVIFVAHNKVQLWKDGPYWADTNIGAEMPWEYGYYFWWGDTIGYKWENNGWVGSDGSSLDDADMTTCSLKIDALRDEGWITADNVLVPAHDAAQVQWGGKWRMPTDEELKDLIDKCEFKSTEMNGVHGWVVRGKGNYASASIFLPAGGYGYGGYGDGPAHAGESFSCWSSVPSDQHQWGQNQYSWLFYAHLGRPGLLDAERWYGRSIRPVQSGF